MKAAFLAVLSGTLDVENPLSLLRGNALVWKTIFDLVDEWYEKHMDRTSVAFDIVSVSARGGPSGLLSFPKPQGIQINMMPIKFLDLDDSLPYFCYRYIRMIDECFNATTVWSSGHIAYLTIHESMVPVGEAQRRPGLHIERPGQILGGGTVNKLEEREFFWGRGYKEKDENVYIDGIFMASNVSDSCSIWPVHIKKPREVSDAHGGIEHMRDCLGPERQLAAGELCWFTDRTPHEATPVKAPPGDPGAEFVARSFFRLVVGQISVWYAKHNTPNPLGIQPEAHISYENKFGLDDDSFS